MKTLLTFIICALPALAGPGFFMNQQGLQISSSPSSSYDPSDYGTVALRFSVRLETPLAHGGSITNLTDTVNGWQVSQSTAAARPLYSTNVIGSYPAALFDGVNDYLNVTTGAMMDVLRNVSSATVMTLVVPTRTGGSVASNPVFTYRRNVNTSSRLVLESNRAGQYFQATARPDDAVSGGSPSESSNFTVSTPYVITLQALFSSGTAAIYRDTAETGSASYTAATTSNTASAEIGLGSGSAGSPGFYTGYIAEHIVWVPALTASNMTNAITALRADYGL